MEFKIGDKACTRDGYEAVVTEIYCVNNKPKLIIFTFDGDALIAQTVKGIERAFKYVGDNNFEKEVAKC